MGGILDKRYQVFVSSTYADLKQERQRVIQTIMEMDCIPAGMELFPASDDQQWEFIKRIISDCDYYVLILGGRYGSVNSEGIGYTEMEFDYALSIGLKVLGFVHNDPSQISMAKSETDSAQRAKYAAFRNKVLSDRLVKMWDDEKELPGLVALSLTKTIRTYPAVGWIRANRVTSEQSLETITILQAENANMRTELIEFKQNIKEEKDLNLADFDEEFLIKFTYTSNSRSGTPITNRDEVLVSWREIFWSIAPDLISHPPDVKVGNLIAKFARQKKYNSTGFAHIDEQCFGTIKIQLMAYKLVSVNYSRTIQGGAGVFWNLTELGISMMTSVRTIKSKNDTEG